MGLRDMSEWTWKRTPYCTCLYCDNGRTRGTHSWNYQEAYVYDCFGNLLSRTTLKDGEVQYKRQLSPGVMERAVGIPQCFIKNNYDPFNPKVQTAVVSGWAGPVTKPAPPGGCVCRKCRMKNEWAAPNEKEGTYICYECR